MRSLFRGLSAACTPTLAVVGLTSACWLAIGVTVLIGANPNA